MARRPRGLTRSQRRPARPELQRSPAQYSLDSTVRLHKTSLDSTGTPWMDVSTWLRDLGLEDYVQAFQANHIDPQVLPRLTADDLIGLGITSIGHRRKLLDAIAALDQGRAPAAPEPTTLAGRRLEAERRQLTVLFCDLVGSTALAARLDPEDLCEVMRGYQATCAEVIGQFEGHVAKFLGDGVLAYFGWPRAHEDDAERAVRAGLQLVETIARLQAHANVRLQARIGIATGPAVVGDLIGEGAAREETVVGETPNLAARLQARAAPGNVVISQATRRLVGGLFELEDLGPVRLKGFAEPLTAFRVTGAGRAEGRFEARRSAGLSPLVGRTHEVALLLDRWALAREGEGQVILLSGEPGIGKSRLVEALRERLAEEAHVAVEYQCSPHRTQSALYPLRARLEQAAGLQRGDSAEAKLDKLEALLAREIGDASASMPLFASLAAIPSGGRYAPLNLTPQQQKLKTFAALMTHFERTAARQPVLLIFEDLHWIDPTSLELVEMLVERIKSLPVLAILTFRPELKPPWVGRPHVTLLALNALGGRHVATLAEQAAGGKGLPSAILEQIVSRTDGVPLFVEELTRAVVEAGLLHDKGDRYVLREPLPVLAIPTTLQDSLMARLDRLGSAKELVQIAACLGREFSYDHLAAVSEIPEDELRAALERLVRSALIVRQGVPAAEIYSFHHALVQETAYASLLKSRRRQLHGRIASIIEERYRQIAEVHPEWLAHHFTEAGLTESAAAYWLQAARRAREAFANREAGAHLQRCLEVVSAASAKDAEPDALDRQKLEALVLLGDLASVAANLEWANRWYELALHSASQAGERTWIANKRHRAREVVRGGARIAFYEHGGGSHTLLLVTPIAYSLGTWQPLVERLCQEFRIVTIDARGSGASDPLVRPYPISEHVQDVRAVIAALGDEPVIGIGMSRGANMVLKLAHHEPHLFDKIVLIGGAPSAPKPPYFAESYLQGCRDALDRGDVEGLLRFHTAHALSEPEMVELRELVVRSRLLMPPETLLSFWDPDPTIDVTGILPEIAVPTLVTHGREDRLVLFQAAEELAARLSNAQLCVFEGKGHFPIFTATEEFCDVLRRFVLCGDAPRCGDECQASGNLHLAEPAQ
jgi:class 3 adenylate cyclase/pimeloyl-ACP methyl ester carboxylesterase